MTAPVTANDPAAAQNPACDANSASTSGSQQPIADIIQFFSSLLEKRA